ncbi:hypothetical protein [Streptomyces violascens]|uniref:hypothetical protein n=1 Tax=Streptomyces violascens TaxID=67381 RepID=UPI00368B7291
MAGFNRTSKPQYLAKNRFQNLYCHSAFFDEIGNFCIVNPQVKVYQRDLTASTGRAPITGDRVPEAKTLISVITDAGNGKVIDAAECVVTTRTSAMPRTRTTAPPTVPGPPAMWTTTSTSARAGPSNPTPIAPSAPTASPPSATALATGASVHHTARNRRPIRRYEGAVNAPLPTGE